MRHAVMIVGFLVAATTGIHGDAAPAENRQEDPAIRVLITSPPEDHASTKLTMDFPPERSVEDALLALGPKAEVVRFFLPVDRQLDACTKPTDCSTVLTELCRLAGDGEVVEGDWEAHSCRGICDDDFRVSASCETMTAQRADDARRVADPDETGGLCLTMEDCLSRIDQACGECADRADWEAGSICSFRCCGETETRIVKCR